MTLRQTLLARVDAYLQEHGLTERAFGIAVANDHKLVPRLRSKSVTLERIEAAERFMDTHPNGIVRAPAAGRGQSPERKPEAA